MKYIRKIIKYNCNLQHFNLTQTGLNLDQIKRIFKYVLDPSFKAS